MTVGLPRVSFPRALVLLGVAMHSGCTQLPVDGPGYRDIHRGAAATLSDGRDPLLIYTSRDAVDYNYALIDINPLVLDVLGDIRPDSFFGTFGTQHGPVPVVRVGVGDVLQISVFESSSGGLFIPGGEVAAHTGSYVTLPAQTVSGAGTISVPYAGPVRVAGRTTSQIQRDIESKLATRAIEPQVVVNIIEQNADTVTVIGDTGNNKIKLTGSGERILDVISRAVGGAGGFGPVGFAGYELLVTLQRKNQIATVPFTRLINNPNENIFVAPGDIIYVHRQPRTFVVFGAFGQIGGGTLVAGGGTAGLSLQIKFDQERLSLNEAIAKAGGLADGRANPAQVFLYRPEHRETLERMGVNLSEFAPNQQWIPTVYRANFRDPSSFFFAQRFQMRDKDIMYAANADANEVLKFLGYVNAWTTTASSAMVDGRTIGDITWGAHILAGRAAVVVP
jgi:polysaccharide biosynthesis/export protein